MRYWINRRARELSLRFMYGLDVKSSDEPLSAVDVKYNISSFWSSNPVSSYYMLKKVRIDNSCLLYTSQSPRDQRGSRMPSSA